MEQKLIDANKVDRIFLRARGIDDTCIGIYEQILELPPVPAIPLDRVKQMREEIESYREYATNEYQKIAFTSCLMVIDKLIAEGEGQ